MMKSGSLLVPKNSTELMYVVLEQRGFQAIRTEDHGEDNSHISACSPCTKDDEYVLSRFSSTLSPLSSLSCNSYILLLTWYDLFDLSSAWR